MESIFLMLLPYFWFPTSDDGGFLSRRDHALDLGGSDYLHFAKAIENTEHGLFVVENLEGRVLRFNEAFQLQATIGKPGEGPGELQYPAQLSVWGDSLVVRDQRGFSFFDIDGNFKSRFRIYSFVNSFVYVRGKIFAVLVAPRKPNYGYIFNEKGEMRGSFGKKFFSSERRSQLQEAYDSERYFSDGRLLSDGQFIYYLNARFGRAAKFDLEGNQLEDKELNTGVNDPMIVQKNLDILENGRKNRQYASPQFEGRAKDTYAVFLDAALVGEHIYLYGEKVFPRTDEFLQLPHRQVRIISAETLELVSRKKVKIQMTGNLSEGVYLHAATSYSREGETGLLCIMSVDGNTKAVILTERSPQ